MKSPRPKVEYVDCENCDAREDSIFCGLHEDTLHQIDRQKTVNVYQRGQNLFVEGNPPFGIYCITKGRVKLSKTTESGKEVLLRIAGPGEVIGHRSLFSESAYNASATALEDTSVCFVGKKTLQGLMSQEAGLTQNILTRMGEQMGQAEDRIVSLAKRNLRERLADTLLSLSETFGQPQEDGLHIDLKLTREELAGYVGSATENIIRHITEFKNEGLIKEESKRIRIVDIEALNKAAGR